MTHAFIGYDNIVDRPDTQISSVDFVATLPVGNIAHPHLVKVARATGSGATIAIDAGGDVEASALGIFGHNLTAGAAVGLEAFPAAGRFTVAGDAGTILSSTDGSDWAAQTSGTTAALWALGYDGGHYVALGGTVLTSPDGAAWTVPAADFAGSGLGYGGGLWVAVGTGGAIRTSPDGVAWTVRASGSTAHLKGATYGAGRHVAVGNVPGGDPTILTSSDGVTWTDVAPPLEGELHHVAYGNGQFIACGLLGAEVLTSPDGVTWTRRSVGPIANYLGVGFSGGVFVLVGGDGAILTSTDGVAWVSRSSGTSATLRAVAASNELWVAVGADGTIVISANLADWTEQASGTTENLNAVAFEASSAGAQALAGAAISMTWRSLLLDFAQPMRARTWLLTVSDPAVARLELGRVFLGPVARPAVTLAYPLTSGIVDRSERKETLGGQILTYRRPRQRSVEFAWAALSAEEAYDALLTAVDTGSGGAADVLFAAAGAESPESLVLWGRLQELGPVEHLGPRLYRKRYRLVEAL